MTGQSYPLAAS
jgi:hypothetical protein